MDVFDFYGYWNRRKSTTYETSEQVLLIIYMLMLSTYMLLKIIVLIAYFLSQLCNKNLHTQLSSGHLTFVCTIIAELTSCMKATNALVGQTVQMRRLV